MRFILTIQELVFNFTVRNLVFFLESRFLDFHALDGEGPLFGKVKGTLLEQQGAS